MKKNYLKKKSTSNKFEMLFQFASIIFLRSRDYAPK